MIESNEAREPSSDVRLLVPLIVGVFLVAVVVAYAAPILDSSLRQSTDYTAAYSEEAARGKAIYASEGCWYCHTQSVRPVPNDLGLGTVTTADRVANDKPPHPGLSRVGPDLACAGDRIPEEDALVEYLKNPRSVRTSSKMPAFSYLSDRELTELAAYLAALRCARA